MEICFGYDYFIITCYIYIGFRYFTYVEMREKTIFNRNFSKKIEMNKNKIIEIKRLPLYRNAPIMGYMMQLVSKDDLEKTKNFLVNENNYSKETLKEMLKDIMRILPDVKVDPYYLDLIKDVK